MISKQVQESKEAYTEVIEILRNMDKIYVNKIPTKLIEFFYRNASKEYQFNLDKNIPFEEQNLKASTVNILAMLNYNYWCEGEEHKKYLLSKYNENEIKYQEKLMEKYSRDNLFKKDNKINTNSNNVIRMYEEPKWYDKILDIIKRIFNK